MIINLTQHKATQEQVEQGVVDLPDDLRLEVVSLLTFDKLPSLGERINSAKKIASIAREAGAKKALIGGAPWFMNNLEKELHRKDIDSLYAFSERKSSERLIGGEVVKTTTFVHKGFIKGSY